MQHLAYLRQQTGFACFSSSSAKKQKTQRLHQPGSWALAPWTAGLRQTFNLIHSLWNLLAFTKSASLPSRVLQSLSSMESLDRYNYMKWHKSSGGVAFRKWPQTLRSAVQYDSHCSHVATEHWKYGDYNEENERLSYLILINLNLKTNTWFSH